MTDAATTAVDIASVVLVPNHDARLLLCYYLVLSLGPINWLLRHAFRSDMSSFRKLIKSTLAGDEPRDW